MKINLKNKKLGQKKIEGSDGNYRVHFKNAEQIKAFFDAIRNSDECFLTNFGGNPTNWAAFVKLRQDGLVLTVNSPRANNGDQSWVAYPSDFGFYCNVWLEQEGIA